MSVWKMCRKISCLEHRIPTASFQCDFFREDKLVERAQSLKVDCGTKPDADLGPVISKQVSSACSKTY